MTEIKLNMAGLIEIANLANDKIAHPIGEQIAANAGGGYRVEKYQRVDIPGWSRTRVITDTTAAIKREIRQGVLAKALGNV